MSPVEVQVNEALTRKVADLARLDLSADELTTFTRHLGDILKYADQLQALDVTGVEPLYHPFEAGATLRPDDAKPFPAGKILEHAPEVWDDSYKVPPIL